MKTFDFCFHYGWGASLEQAYRICSGVKAEMNNQGKSLSIVTFSQKIYNYLLSNGMDDVFIVLPTNKKEIHRDEILSLYYTLGFRNFSDFYRTEQLVWKYKEKKAIEYSYRLLQSIINLRDAFSAKYYITYEGDEFDHNAFRFLCRLHNGTIIYEGISSFKNRLFFHRNENRFWVIPPYSGECSSEIESEIINYMDSYTKNKSFLYGGDPDDWDTERWNFKIPKRILSKIFIRSDFAQDDIILSAKRLFGKIFRRQFFKLFYKMKYNDGDVYYFPLHMPSDSQLTQRALPFYNQVALVEQISCYIPYPSKLYVKEHPAARGYMDIQSLKKIRSLGNVVLLDPRINSHDIIKKAKAIFTINSNVGYEALMYGKPVVTFGRSFYRGEGLTLDISSLYELENIISEINKFQVDQSRFIKLIHRIYANTFDLDVIKYWNKSESESSNYFVLCLLKWVEKNLHTNGNG